MITIYRKIWNEISADNNDAVTADAAFKHLRDTGHSVQIIDAIPIDGQIYMAETHEEHEALGEL